MSDAMLHEARTVPGAHPGCIQMGIELVSQILTNRVSYWVCEEFLWPDKVRQSKNQKCLSCDSGARGKSMSTKGQALRGDGAGFLNKCRCPIDTAATEFWMYKVTAGDPRVPERDDQDITPSDFALNPVSLRLIGAAIEAASGLTTERLFDVRRDRLENTIHWAMKEIYKGSLDKEQKHKIRQIKKGFAQTMDDVRDLDSVD
jgi:hypothetical protein